jgi:dTDP-3-amino-3,4,6-trideoxy-alpha-D-glucose transaminase
MKVPFLDLARHTAANRERIDAALARVVGSGRFILEAEVAAFEREFGAFCGASRAVGVASGTDAIAIALLAVGIEAGDEVVTAANTCVPTIVGIEAAGARPVLADVEPHTCTLDVRSVEAALTEQTRAIVPVHLYGRCADLAPLLELASAHGLKVVEDCAQAHGAEYGGRSAGSLGHAAAFSFYPSKNLGALGDGGAVVTSDHDVADRAALPRNFGERERFRHVLRGRNSRLDAIQAAILRELLPLVPAWNERRRVIAGSYGAALTGSPVSKPDGDGHVYHLYVLRVPDRDGLRARLEQRGIGTAIHYPLPVHRQPAYLDLAPARRSLAVSEELAEQVVSLPLHPTLTDAEVDYIAEALGSLA